MKKKLKICHGCGDPRIIWKNDQGKRYCKICWSRKQTMSGATKESNRTSKPLARRSPKRSRQEAEYLRKRKNFLLGNPVCQANLPGICTHTSTDVHHTYAGSNRNKYFLEESTWLSVCRSCHNWIHLNAKLARELGLLK